MNNASVAINNDLATTTKNLIITKRKIGKITYLIAASSSDTATDTLHKKMEKVILKDLKNTQTLQNTGLTGNFSK